MKEKRIDAVASMASAQVINIGLKTQPLRKRLIIERPIRIINIEIDIGAITGAIHGAGIKNNISHSRRLGGQLIVTFNQI